MKRKRGRPRLTAGIAHTLMLTVRVSADERLRIEAAARDCGTALSEWLREVLLEAARACEEQPGPL